MKISKQDVLRMCFDEMVRQGELREEGRFDFTPDAAIPSTQKLPMLTEEIGEVAREIQIEYGWVKNEDREPELQKELVQLAAIALNWARVA